jgi:hypothetical protein
MDLRQRLWVRSRIAFGDLVAEGLMAKVAAKLKSASEFVGIDDMASLQAPPR